MSADNKNLVFINQSMSKTDYKNINSQDLIKKDIKDANKSFDKRFHEGECAHQLVKERSQFMDLILTRVWNLYSWQSKISLLAVGGYGRGELHPHSDIDLLLLTTEESVDKDYKNIEEFLAFLWDLNLQIGHSVRSINQCASAARKDITILTNLLETRLIIGIELMRKRLLDRIRPQKLYSSKAFYRGKLKEQSERYRKHGGTDYNLEPNVKEAPGGLRDIQLITWIAIYHFNVSCRSDLVTKNFFLEDEYHRLYQDEEFLWRVRYGLHIIAGRQEERLLFDHQRKLAVLLGYQDSEGKLGVEKFMQRYYRTVLSIRGLTDVLHQYLNEVIYKTKTNVKIKSFNNYFVIHGDLIDTVSESIFQDHPPAMLELFVILGENENINGIRASVIRKLLQSAHLIDKKFRSSKDNQNLFLRLLRSPYKLSVQLNRMNRYGILGKYLPAFGKIIGQMQHDLFHIYPVDVHTLKVIENIRRLARPEVAKRFPIPSHIFKNLSKPELLIIAALYHDIAKGRGGDHSKLGGAEVVKFAKLHDLTLEEEELLKWLIENHLLMSAVSQREDVSDPKVIGKFASIVGNTMHLDFLYVLTVGDINATNPNLWTEWKGSLMQKLYMATNRYLNRVNLTPMDKNRWSANAKHKIFRRLGEIGISSSAAESVWAELGSEFFLRETTEDIVRYTSEIIKKFQVKDIPTSKNNHIILLKNIGIEVQIATQIFVFSKDIQNTLAVIAAALEKLELNVQDARLHTNGNGDAFDVFYVLTSDGKPISNENRLRERITESLSKAISNPQIFSNPPSRRTPRRLKSFKRKTKAIFSSNLENNTTVLEVLTPDRPGLLALLASIFFRFNLRLLTAKISTLGEQVEDIFYLTNSNYKPINDQNVCQELSKTICEELDSRNQ